MRQEHGWQGHERRRPTGETERRDNARYEMTDKGNLVVVDRRKELACKAKPASHENL